MNAFIFQGDEICIMADVPHLLKNMRNAFMNQKSLKIHQEFVSEYNLPNNLVKFEHIRSLILFDSVRSLKIAPHLNTSFLNLGNYQKMKVSFASKLLSQATGHALRLLVKEYKYPKEILTTAHFCEMVGRWYEIMASRKKFHSFIADQTQENDIKIAFLNKFMTFYCSMTLHDSQKESFKPTQTGVILSTFSIIKLQKRLLEKDGFEYFLPGKTTNDPIEQYHGDVRSIFKNPTGTQFKRCAKVISVTQYMANIKGGSYDSDDSQFLIDFESFKKSECKKDEELRSDVIDMPNPRLTDTAEKSSLGYFAGYILKKTICSKIDGKFCQKCEKYFITGMELDDTLNSFIKLKEFRNCHLLRPSFVAHKIFEKAELIFRAKFSAFDSNESGLIDKLTELMLDKLVSDFQDVPMCHFKSILKRIVKVRFIFDAEQEDQNLQIVHKKTITSEANASKTAKALREIN